MCRGGGCSLAVSISGAAGLEQEVADRGHSPAAVRLFANHLPSPCRRLPQLDPVACDYGTRVCAADTGQGHCGCH